MAGFAGDPDGCLLSWQFAAIQFQATRSYRHGYNSLKLSSSMKIGHLIHRDRISMLPPLSRRQALHRGNKILHR